MAHSEKEWEALIGRRVRVARRLRGLTQEALGQRLGLTFQQVQKYERGTNRIASSKLAVIASVLDQPVGFFYETEPEAVQTPRQSGGRRYLRLVSALSKLEREKPDQFMAAYMLLCLLAERNGSLEA